MFAGAGSGRREHTGDRNRLLMHRRLAEHLPGASGPADDATVVASE
jgi:hypothetical protein